MTHAVRLSGSATAPTQAGQHRALNAMRAVAAILVVVYHLRALVFVPPADAGGGAVTSVLYAVTGLGPAAVLVFFVLSGYWVGGSVLAAFRRERFRWSTYVTARLSRLWVVLVPALVITAVLDHVGLALLPDTSIYLGDPAYHDTVPTDLADRLTLGTALGNVAFLQNIAVPTFGTNVALWSLAYEAVFYAVLPLALYAWRGRGGVRARVLSAVCLVVVCAVAGPKVLVWLPVWLMGAFVARFRDRIGAWLAGQSRIFLASARGVASVMFAVTLWAAQVSFSHRNVLLLAAATTVLLALLVEDLSWSGTPGRVLNGLSRYAESSYSLYAVHMPFAAMLAALLTPRVDHRWSSTSAHWALFAALAVLLALTGWALAQVTERHTGRLRAAVERLRLRVAPHGQNSAARDA